MRAHAKVRAGARSGAQRTGPMRNQVVRRRVFRPRGAPPNGGQGDVHHDCESDITAMVGTAKTWRMVRIGGYRDGGRDERRRTGARRVDGNRGGRGRRQRALQHLRAVQRLRLRHGLQVHRGLLRQSVVRAAVRRQPVCLQPVRRELQPGVQSALSAIQRLWVSWAMQRAVSDGRVRRRVRQPGVRARVPAVQSLRVRQRSVQPRVSAVRPVPVRVGRPLFVQSVQTDLRGGVQSPLRRGSLR